GPEAASTPGAAPVDLLDRLQLRQIEGRELREPLAHRLPRSPVGGEQRDLDPRMPDQQPHELRAGIARRAEHADPRLGGQGRFLHGCTHWYAKCGRNATMRAAIARADGLP